MYIYNLAARKSKGASAGKPRRGFTEGTDPREELGADHPIIRTHPVTGRKALFLGRRRNACIQGMVLKNSERLLDAMWARATPARSANHR